MTDHPKPPPPPRQSIPTTVGVGAVESRRALHVVQRRDDTPETPFSAVREPEPSKAEQVSMRGLTGQFAEVKKLISEALTRQENRITELEGHVKDLAGQWLEQMSKVNARLDTLDARQAATEQAAKDAKAAAEEAEDWAEKTGKHTIVVLDQARVDAERRAKSADDLRAQLDEKGLGLVVERRKLTAATVAQIAVGVLTSSAVIAGFIALLARCGG